LVGLSAIAQAGAQITIQSTHGGGLAGKGSGLSRSTERRYASADQVLQRPLTSTQPRRRRRSRGLHHIGRNKRRSVGPKPPTLQRAPRGSQHRCGVSSSLQSAAQPISRRLLREILAQASRWTSWSWKAALGASARSTCPTRTMTRRIWRGTAHRCRAVCRGSQFGRVALAPSRSRCHGT
jgi:hypothetical protein